MTPKHDLKNTGTSFSFEIPSLLETIEEKLNTEVYQDDLSMEK